MERDDWLRKRVFQLEKAVEALIVACAHQDIEKRKLGLRTALENMPE